MVAGRTEMKGAQLSTGIVSAGGAVYSLWGENTTLVIFFTSLFAVAVLAPGLVSRTSEISLGVFRASFRGRIKRSSALSEEEKRDLKKRIEGAGSLDEVLDVLASFAEGRADKNE
jgi:hypothetical protein